MKGRVLEDMEGPAVRAVALDVQARALLEGVGAAIEAALVNPGTFIRTPWIAVAETYTQLGHDAMSVDAALVPTVHVCLHTYWPPLPQHPLPPSWVTKCALLYTCLYITKYPTPTHLLWRLRCTCVSTPLFRVVHFLAHRRCTTLRSKLPC